MSTQQHEPSTGRAGAAAAARALWSAGDYHAFARLFTWPLGAELVTACGIGPGQRVLDVATGTGNVAIQAAQAGAAVTAVDITPAQLATARREAAAAGVEVEWIEADAQALPVAAGAFDAVTSCAGAMFAPDHRTVADELLRVCRPGGTIGMANYTPDGLAGEFFALVGRYAPAPPAGSLPPLLWGTEAHVRSLLGDRAALALERRDAIERLDGTPEDYAAVYRRTFGPIAAILAGLADEPERAAALERDLVDFARRHDRSPEPGRVEYRYEYLLVLARPAG